MPISVAVLMIAGEIPAQANTNKNLYLAQAASPQLPPGTDLNDLPRDLPTPPVPDTQQDPSITPLPSVEDFLESPPNNLPWGEEPESEIQFKVKEFRLEGNTVLEAEAVEAIVKDYRDRPITFADLLELETRLTKLYTDNGYINSGVVIPSQDVSKGVIKIQALEGGIAEINVKVEGRLKESYVRSRLGRGTTSPLNIDKLQEALQLLQLNPLVESLNAELAVGTSRDRWILDVDVNQKNAFDPGLFVNNNRNPSVGSVERGLELNHNNVLGYADRFRFVFKNTNGSNDFDTSYRIPVNSLDGTVGFRFRHVDSKIIEGDFEDLNIKSLYDKYELNFRQPVIVSANSESTQELALGVELSHQSNGVTLQNEPFPDLSPGADENGNTRISALRFFQDWTRRTRQDVFAARSQFSVGLDIFDATVNQGAPDSRFFAWRGQAQWLRQLDPSSNINFILRSDLQLSPDDLLPLERFSLGGADSVRGYRKDVILSDSGLFLSAEVRIPFYRWSQGKNNLSVLPFIDFGTSWSNSANLTNQNKDTLASLGVGLRLDLSDIFRARLDYGIPLIEVSDTNNTLQEQGLYFSLEYFPF